MSVLSSTLSIQRFHRSLLQGLALTYISFIILLPLSVIFLEASKRSWQQLWQVITAPVAVEAYKLSFGAALLAALINSIFGVILAWILVRYEFPGRRLADGLVDLPFAMPSVVAGIALVSLYGSGGVLGHYLDPGTFLGNSLQQLGIKQVNLTSSVLGVVFAKVFVTLPFVVRTVQPVLMEIEPEVEEAAHTLGANAWQTFWRILFPQLLPAILTGFTLAFARAVGEYGVVLIISGNIPYETMISSVYIYRRLEEYDYSGATAVAIVLLLFSLVILICTNLVQWWSLRYER
ncbi:MAG: sulfate ABC transporter permease subunit CysT [Brasilonema octagenarum HA4186-MV1]|jgi:sulfate transport system permease protein|uniref:Sulfate transport system permease protein CysT n=1 Tax=Brasilonema octagenarum UFV-OR1 TaxID=417115 RepID=A0ABX1M4X6_9CYAN|nr:sulfate ABC transporter permease subunit CysT [Brasilonema octagenarum]MBW4624069.1 sulfate ABC transporter permease subunit CysT [Brasilonema octagenarum HA4186-MV1]NMF63572.1 sulfate ABC transporter permease subunit CysT [Brasilonema octagenarum UFV-OR1]